MEAGIRLPQVDNLEFKIIVETSSNLQNSLNTINAEGLISKLRNDDTFIPFMALKSQIAIVKDLFESHT